MTVTFKTFDDLDLQELYDIMKLRQIVFVVEQNCPYVDADDKDQHGYHLMYHSKHDLLAYARLLPIKVSYENYVSIGRVITAPSARGKGWGKKIMEEAINKCQVLWPKQNIKISAQVYALPFYQQLGFQPVGEEYLEDDIPHQAMVLPST